MMKECNLQLSFLLLQKFVYYKIHIANQNTPPRLDWLLTFMSALKLFNIIGQWLIFALTLQLRKIRQSSNKYFATCNWHILSISLTSTTYFRSQLKSRISWTNYKVSRFTNLKPLPSSLSR